MITPRRHVQAGLNDWSVCLCASHWAARKLLSSTETLKTVKAG